MIDEIKKLFELTQYKFIMQQDNNSLDMLRKVFAGQLSESEIAAIPHLPTGDVILSIGAVKNIHFHVEVTDEELMLFGEVLNTMHLVLKVIPKKWLITLALIVMGLFLFFYLEL